MRLATGTLVALTLTLTPADVCPAGQAEEILAAAKTATGGAAWDGLRSLHTKGKLALGGMSGTYESWDDVRSGRTLDRFALGPMSGAQGFDGTTLWSQDSSGQVRLEQGGEERAAAANDSYRRSLAYWYPDRRSATFELLGRQEEGGRAFNVLRITPNGGRPYDLWVDATTHLFDRTIEKAALETRKVFFSDYRQVAGVLLPFAIRSTNGDERYDQLGVVESIQAGAPVDDALFAAPAPPPPDWSFAEGATSTKVPFNLLNNHIYLKVTLNGAGPFTLLCDTGGVNIVTPEIAAQLGLTSEGRLEGRGVGEKSEDVGLTKVGTVQLGDVTLRDQVFMVFPLTELSAVEGVPASGLVGYEIFKRFVVTIDYERSLLTLSTPAAFRPSGSGTVVPFTFNAHIPQVEGTIDGIPGKFDIDTGSRASLTLLAPFVEKNGLKERYGATVAAVTGWGVGGPGRGLLARGKLLKLGGVEIGRPVVELSLQSKGAFTDPYVAGNVGGGVLKRFNITFDYQRQKLIFERNANHGAEDSWDRSGMWINLADGAFEVVDVISGGPAAQAGVAVGDRITAIDGKAANELSLPAVRLLLRMRPPGTEVRLRLAAASGPREIVLVLRDLV